MTIFEKIKAFLAKIIAPDAGSIPEIEGMMRDLDDEVARAHAELRKIEARRSKLLMDDDEAALDKDYLASEKLRRTIEKADLVRPSLIDRLLKAQAVAREKLFKEMKAEGVKIASELREAALALAEVNERAINWHERVRTTLGEATGSIDLVRIAHPYFTRNFMEEWQRNIANMAGPRRVSTPAAVAKPAITPVAKLVTPIPPAVPQSAQVRTQQDLPAIPPKGHRRVMIMRAGYEAPDGSRLKNGDLIDLPEDVADKIVKNGAADYADPPASDITPFNFPPKGKKLRVLG